MGPATLTGRGSVIYGRRSNIFAFLNSSVKKQKFGIYIVCLANFLHAEISSSKKSIKNLLNSLDSRGYFQGVHFRAISAASTVAVARRSFGSELLGPKTPQKVLAHRKIPHKPLSTEL